MPSGTADAEIITWIEDFLLTFLRSPVPPSRRNCLAGLAEILKQLEALPEGERVMLKLTIPAEAGLFQPLVDHPKVLRVVALSGGFSRQEACAELARNPGMIASFSRALLSDLRADQSDAEFDSTLGTAIDEIHAASVAA